MSAYRGKVGIGSYVPAGKLHVYNASAGTSYTPDGADQFIIENNDSLIKDIRTPNGNTGGILFSAPQGRGRGSITYNQSTDILSFGTPAGAGVLQLLGNGDMHLGASDSDVRMTFGSTGVNANNNSNNIRAVGSNLMLNYPSTHIFEVNGASRLSINNASVSINGCDGQVIKTSAGGNGGAFLIRNGSSSSGSYCRLYLSPTANDATSRAVIVQAENVDGNNNMALVFKVSAGDDPAERMRITSAGLVTITNNNNTHNFKANAGSSNSWFGVYDDANDSANIEIRRSDSAQVFYVLGHNGNYHFAGSDVSDRDLKENIVDVPSGSLELVKQLKPRTYNFKSSEGFDNSSRTGFIAQEVADVMTTDHRVASGTDGDKDMGIDPVGLIAHLTKAIQEQNTLIEALTARITTLEG